MLAAPKSSPPLAGLGTERVMRILRDLAHCHAWSSSILVGLTRTLISLALTHLGHMPMLEFVASSQDGV